MTIPFREKANPLTDELTPDAKAELAAIFADLKRQYPPVRIGRVMSVPVFLSTPWERRGW